MPDDPVIDALRAAVASETRTKPRKGDLQRWMRKRQRRSPSYGPPACRGTSSPRCWRSRAC